MTRKYYSAGVLALTLFAAAALAQGKAKGAGKVLRVPQVYGSIQKALDEADPGDTVFVDEGVYKESVIMRDDIALIGAAAERTIIKGNRRKPALTGAQGATIRHITVENGRSGILCANAVMTIENCVIRGNRGTGIHCLISLPVIRDNVIFRNASSGIFCETTRSHKGYIANNVIAENGYSGVMLAGLSEVLLENNVFYFNKQYGIFTSEGARRSRIIYNALYGNRQPANSFAVIDQTNIQQDPGYAAPDADGFTLFDAPPGVLMGKGKDGKDIGPQKRAFYKPSQAKNNPPAPTPVTAPPVVPAQAAPPAPTPAAAVETPVIAPADSEETSEPETAE